MLLKDLIHQVRQELIEAAAQSEQTGEAPILSLDGVTIEVNFVVEKEHKLKAGASARLLAVVGFDAGGEQRYSREQVHKVTVNLSGAKPPPAPSFEAVNPFEQFQFETLQPEGTPVSPALPTSPKRPLRPVNFKSIKLHGRVGDERVWISVEDILKNAAEVKASFPDMGTEEGFAIDISDALSRFGRKLK